MTRASVRCWLEEHALIEPSLLDSPGLDSLVGERIAAFGGSESAYVEELARSSDEVDRLIAGVAVPETCFFRYPRSYDLLLEFLQRLRATGATTLRMLSIGCATGQEPYSMAMTALHAGWPADLARVEGLDRNSEFLRIAAVGEYGASSIRSEIPAWAVQFLQRRADTIAIDPAARALVRFTRTDITSPASLRGMGPYNVVFCRNVLIYLNATTRSRLLDSIGAELVPGGMLFVGHAEQMMRGDVPLHSVTASHAFAMERPDGRSIRADAPRPARSAPVRPQAPQQRGAAPASVLSPVGSPAVSRPGPAPAPEESLEVARELADAGHTDDGQAMIRAIMARQGPSAPAIELLGIIRMSVNDTVGAKRLFEQAVYLDPTRSTSLLQLAVISERSGEKRRAEAYWDRARRASTAARQEHRP